MSKNNFKKIKKLLKILGIFGLVATFIFKQRQDILETLDNEKNHLVKLLKKEEEQYENFYKKWKRKLKHYFIPHEENDHKPISLRSKKLLSYAIVLVLIKLAVTGFLFFYYPSPAELANIVTSKIIELANAERAKNGIPLLQVDPALNKFAVNKAQDMIDRAYFSHETPEGKKPWQWIDREEYDYVYAGENLAMDFTSAELIHQAFMKSPTHRKNILNPKYKNMGVAVVSGQMNGRETDILVQFFATRRSQLASLAAVQESTGKVERSKVIKTPTPSTEKVLGQEKEIVPKKEDEDFSEFKSSISPGIIVVTTETSSHLSLVDKVIEYSNIIFIAFLVFISMILFLNVVIKIKVQHPKLILQSLAVIALVVALILVKFHFIEKVGQQFMIL